MDIAAGYTTHQPLLAFELERVFGSNMLDVITRRCLRMFSAVALLWEAKSDPLYTARGFKVSRRLVTVVNVI